MNKLPNQTRIQILSMLVEGSSLRSISRITGVSINTVTKLLVDAGKACSDFHDQNVVGVKSKSIQCDEIWSFNYAKQKNVAGAVAAPEMSGDVWTWTALDSDTKLIASWLVGSRDTYAATMFLRDLRSRVVGLPQITTDGFLINRPWQQLSGLKLTLHNWSRFLAQLLVAKIVATALQP